MLKVVLRARKREEEKERSRGEGGVVVIEVLVVLVSYRDTHVLSWLMLMCTQLHPAGQAVSCATATTAMVDNLPTFCWTRPQSTVCTQGC